MSITSWPGANVLGFVSAPYPGMPSGTNPEVGPTLTHDGIAYLDTRTQFTFIPGENFGKKTYGTLSSHYQCIDQAPAARFANNIATAQTATAGTALTLVSSNTTGVTVGTAITRGDTGAAVSGLLALDSAMTSVAFGPDNTIQIWSPGTAIARNVVVTSNGNDSAGVYTVV